MREGDPSPAEGRQLKDPEKDLVYLIIKGITILISRHIMVKNSAVYH
jgi:hypothetical protein